MNSDDQTMAIVGGRVSAQLFDDVGACYMCSPEPFSGELRLQSVGYDAAPSVPL